MPTVRRPKPKAKGKAAAARARGAAMRKALKRAMHVHPSKLKQPTLFDFQGFWRGFTGKPPKADNCCRDPRCVAHDKGVTGSTTNPKYQISLCKMGFVPEGGPKHDTDLCPVEFPFDDIVFACGCCDHPKDTVRTEDPHQGVGYGGNDSDEEPDLCSAECGEDEDDEGRDEDHVHRYRFGDLGEARMFRSSGKHLPHFSVRMEVRHLDIKKGVIDSKKLVPFGFWPHDHFIHWSFLMATQKTKGIGQVRSLLVPPAFLEVSAWQSPPASLQGLPTELKLMVINYLVEEATPKSHLALQCLITASGAYAVIVYSKTGKVIVKNLRSSLRSKLLIEWFALGFPRRKKFYESVYNYGALAPRSWIPGRPLSPMKTPWMNRLRWNIFAVRTWYEAEGSAEDEEAEDGCDYMLEDIRNHVEWAAVKSLKLRSDRHRFNVNIREQLNESRVSDTSLTLPVVAEIMASAANFIDTNHETECWRTLMPLPLNEEMEDAFHEGRCDLDAQPRSMVLVFDQEACDSREVLTLLINHKGEVINHLTMDWDSHDFRDIAFIHPPLGMMTDHERHHWRDMF